VLGWDLRKISFEGPEAELTQTKVCQPALFVHGLALWPLCAEAGNLPAVKFAMGLSLGEVTALTAAGVLISRPASRSSPSAAGSCSWRARSPWAAWPPSS